MKRVLFAGCSYTQGTGFDELEHSPDLWVNLLHKNSALRSHELINISVAGRSNVNIFNCALDQLTQTHYEYAFVQWTSMPRYEIQLGLELYSTRMVFMPNAECFDVNTNEINYNKSYLKNINDRFTSLANLHYEIIDLVRYVNILLRVAQLTNTKIFFINGLCPWDTDYFTPLDDFLPNQLTDFTQKLINSENRDDQEIHKLYHKIHQEYQQAGGIQAQHWLNLYNSMLDLKLDVNKDGLHPGNKSNQLYYETFLSALQQRI